MHLSFSLAMRTPESVIDFARASVLFGRRREREIVGYQRDKYYENEDRDGDDL